MKKRNASADIHTMRQIVKIRIIELIPSKEIIFVLNETACFSFLVQT